MNKIYAEKGKAALPSNKHIEQRVPVNLQKEASVPRLRVSRWNPSLIRVTLEDLHVITVAHLPPRSELLRGQCWPPWCDPRDGPCASHFPKQLCWQWGFPLWLQTLVLAELTFFSLHFFLSACFSVHTLTSVNEFSVSLSQADGSRCVTVLLTRDECFTEILFPVTWVLICRRDLQCCLPTTAVCTVLLSILTCHLEFLCVCVCPLALFRAGLFSEQKLRGRERHRAFPHHHCLWTCTAPYPHHF